MRRTLATRRRRTLRLQRLGTCVLILAAAFVPAGRMQAREDARDVEALAAWTTSVEPSLAAARTTWWVPLGARWPGARVLLGRLAILGARGRDGAVEDLVRCAAGRDLDPWLLLDDLAATASPGAVRCYARHAERQRRELEEYLERQAARTEPADARALLERATASWSAGRLADAMSLGAPGSAAGPPTLRELRLLGARAATASAAGRFSEAADLAVDAAQGAEELAWWSGALGALAQAGEAVRRSGDARRESELLERLLALAGAHGTLAEQLEVLVALSEANERLGDGPQAMQQLLEAARLAEEAAEPVWVGRAHSRLMEVLTRQGALGAALESRQLAESAFTRGSACAALRGEHLLRVTLLEAALGRPDLAHDALDRAASALGSPPGAHARAAIALLRAELARGAGCLDLTRVAIDAAEAAVADPEAAATPSEVLRMAFLEAEQQLREARCAPPQASASGLKAARERVLAVAAQARAGGRRAEALEARAWGARLAQALGEPVAEDLAAVALEATRLRLRPLAVDTLTALVRARLDAGEPGPALAAARRAFQQAAEVGRGLPDAPRSSLQERLGELCEVAVEAAAAASDGSLGADAAALWLDVLETRQASALQHALGARHLLESTGEAECACPSVEQRARGRRDAYAALLAQQSVGDVSERGQELLRRSEARFAAALRAEQAAVVEWERRELCDARAEELAPLAAGLEELRAALPYDAAYVAYALLEDQAWALLVTRDSARPIRLAVHGDELRVLREALARVADVTAVEGAPTLLGDEAEAARRQLRHMLLDPLELPAGTRTLVVCPDPALVFVPWSWVAGPELGLAVALEPSATALAWLAARVEAPGRGTLAVGDPAYPDRLGLALAPSTLRGVAGSAAVLPTFRPLPFSASEASAAASHPGDRLLLRSDATEDGFWRALALRGPRARWRSVHLAVHGLVDPRHPALALLALAPSEREDGLLTLGEILRHRVPADLVVLSACRTARGRVSGAEGLLGLCRGFLVAGASQVIASLWDVPDEPTSELMAALYAGLDRGLDAPRALLEAQAAVRARYPDPAAWAAWVLWGRPQGPGPASPLSR